MTLRVVALCLGLAFLFGSLSPLIDHKLANTFLGATHLPPGAIAVLLLLLLVVNPLLKLVSARLALFLGLVLGDVTMMVFWLLIDGWQGRTNHGLMPS